MAIGVLGRERGRCAGMSIESPAIRRVFVHDRAYDRVPEPRAPRRVLRTDHIRLDKLVEQSPRTDVGPDCDPRDRSGSNGARATSFTALPKPALGAQQCCCQSRRRPRDAKAPRSAEASHDVPD